MPQFQLTSQQISMLVIGVSAAVGLYLLIKILQWIFRRRLARKNAPLMRPKEGSSIPFSVGQEELKSSSLSAAHAAASDSSESETNFGAASSHESANDEPVLQSSGASHRDPSSLKSFWAVEPKNTKRFDPFEADGVEYPYATTADYRFGSMTPIMSELLPSSEEGRRETTRTLRNAGNFEPHAWQNFAALRYLGIILPLLLFGALLVVVPEPVEPYMIAGLVFGPALGWALPILMLRRRASERLHLVEQAMPDMLDLLNMCVSQGMTVTQSLGRISQEFAPVYPALSKELRIVSDQAKVGSLTQALGNFSDRVDVPEVHSFTSLLIQTEQMGTSVSEALAEYSDSMRESQRQRADEKANAATFKLLFPTVLCLMPAVFLLLMGPALIELNKFFTRGGVQGLNSQANQVIENQR